MHQMVKWLCVELRVLFFLFAQNASYEDRRKLAMDYFEYYYSTFFVLLLLLCVCVNRYDY